MHSRAALIMTLRYRAVYNFDNRKRHLFPSAKAQKIDDGHDGVITSY